MQHAFDLSEPPAPEIPDFSRFPSTRYQGSKRKLLSFLHAACSNYEFSAPLDLYSGTCSVALMFRRMGKNVSANDYLQYNWTTGKVLLGITNNWLEFLSTPLLIDRALAPNSAAGTLVQSHFEGIYFPDRENKQIDDFCANLRDFPSQEADLLIYLMGQAMLMKRPYNLFHRANLEMRTKDVPRTFGNAKTWETSFSAHMKKLGANLAKCDFSGPEGRASCLNTNKLDEFLIEPDFVYLDPPYLNARNVPVDYSTFYHFLDGLVDYSLFSQGDEKYPHKPIALKKSRWKTSEGGLSELRAVLKRWPNARIAISYRGDGRPSVNDIKSLLNVAGYEINEHTAVDYKYALSKNFDATEDLIIGTPKRA